MSETPQNDAKVLDKQPVPSKTPPQRDPKLAERDALLARMDAKVEERRKQEQEEFLRSSDRDPAAWLLHQQMTAEANAQPAAEVETAEQEAEPIEPIEPVEEAAPVARPAERVSTKGEDPLGQYVVRVDGKPMFKTLVDGKEELIPLDRARQQLQKHLAADVRLQQAAELRKQLDARAAALQQTEAQLKARQPTAQAPAAVNFDAEAIEIVRSLVTEPEDKAAARLAQTLKTIRQAQAPVDVEAITKEAARVATRTLEEREQNRALKNGFETFTSSYRDIASDPELFAIADRKTDAIAAEHPEWDPGQVMLEAGKQTREWLKSIGAPVKDAAAPNAQSGATSNRQQRKENLRPMPATRTARPAPTDTQEDSFSPADAIAEIRRSRGQPL
jgi:hypothetical protein